MFEKFHKMILISLILPMTSIPSCIKPREVLFYRCLSALPIKPLTYSNYSTPTSLTPRCLYQFMGSYVAGKSGFLIYSIGLEKEQTDLTVFNQKFSRVCSNAAT